MSETPFLSVITPAFNESLNLPVFYEELKKVCAEQGWTWEWLAVDDHSRDNTYEVMQEIAAKDPRVRCVRLARNSGSHLALMCGLEHVTGRVVAMLAADMQDPPAFLPTMIAEWKGGAHVVWATRGKRHGEKLVNVIFARVYYFIVRKFEGLENMPSTGADFLIMDRKVADALRKYTERNISFFLLVNSMGFVQKYVVYDKQARLYGQTGWNFKKKLKLIYDSFVPFSPLPLELITWAGGFLFLGAFLLAACCAAECWMGTCRNWQTLPALVLAVGGAQMVALGGIGQVLWRVLDETRARPRYLIEADTAAGDPKPPAP